MDAKPFLCISAAISILVIASCASSSNSAGEKTKITPTAISSFQDLCLSEDVWGSTDVDIHYIEARLSSQIGMRHPSTEWLLLYLLPTPCTYEENALLYNILMGFTYGDTSYVSRTLDDHYVKKLEADVDQDGEDEIIVWGGGASSSLFAGILDWDGNRWRVAWFDRVDTRYSGRTRVRVEDFDNDGQSNVVLEYLTHPCSGTGVLCQSWDITLLQCEHLSCTPIWTHPVASVDKFMMDYTRISSEYRFLDQHHLSKADIEIIQHGIEFRWDFGADMSMCDLGSIDVLTTTRTIYQWNGHEYALNTSTVISGERPLSINPVTTTVDFDGDGRAEYAVYDWAYSGKQTLSIYRNTVAQQPVQVFTATITGSPETGIFIREVNDHDLPEIVLCQTSFELESFWDARAEWPSMQPVCKTYEWNSRIDGFRAKDKRG